MTLTRRQLFAALAASAWAPFLGRPRPTIPFRRIWARVHIGRNALTLAKAQRAINALKVPDGEIVAYAPLAQFEAYCEHPGKSARITGIDR